MKRRTFMQRAGLSGLGLAITNSLLACNTNESKEKATVAAATKTAEGPMVISTWNVPNANNKAWEVLAAGGNALDAVEQGVKVEEADTKNQSVGKGGRPDRDGRVTLDACIMDHQGNYGAVMCVQNYTHVISIARKVMEDTPHVILAGAGAEQFAAAQGFEAEDLLTEATKKDWEKWKETSDYKPVINIENHDTIGMLAIDAEGNISGACTTSGLAYKMAGRVGDSPVIGSGLFVDNEVGACTATGMGEEVLKTVGSFLVVELMRHGKSPQEACEEAIRRIVKDNPRAKDVQVGFIAINKAGETGAYCIHPGFQYIVNRSEKTELFDGKAAIG